MKTKAEHKAYIYHKIKMLMDEELDMEYNEHNVGIARQIVLVDVVCDILERLDKLDADKTFDEMREGVDE